MVDMAVALAGSDCERLRSGWLAQPANAVSSLAYVAVGVWLLWRCRRAGVHRGALLAGGVGMVGIGVGSVAYHGPQPGWAGLAHDGSVVGLALPIIGHNIWLLVRASVRRATAYTVAGAVTVAVLAETGRAALLSPVLVGAVVIGAALTHPRATTEVAVAAGRAAAGWTGLALAAYVAGRTGSALCHPGTLWQLHAAWHGLSAVALGLAVLGFSARSPDRSNRAERPWRADRVRHQNRRDEVACSGEVSWIRGPSTSARRDQSTTTPTGSSETSWRNAWSDSWRPAPTSGHWIAPGPPSPSGTG
jgi:hypothetical protein